MNLLPMESKITTKVNMNCLKSWLKKQCKQYFRKQFSWLTFRKGISFTISYSLGHVFNVRCNYPGKLKIDIDISKFTPFFKPKAVGYTPKGFKVQTGNRLSPKIE